MMLTRKFLYKEQNFSRMSFLINYLKRLKSSQQWLNRQKVDPYVEKAKIQNYRCRSAFKLLEMNQKANILQPGQSVIDLGAAPGSWTQVAVQKTNSDNADPSKPIGTVLAIDKLQIFPIEGATIMSNMDFSTIEAHDKVVKALGGRKADLVLSDMAPSATGVRELDKDRIIGLCYMAIRFAALVTRIDGSLLFKVWDGKEVPILEMDLERFYKSIKIMKPNASRSESSEKFILARGFKGVQQPLGNENYTAVIPTYHVTRMGLTRGDPVDWSMEELVELLELPPGCAIIKARRLNRKVFKDGLVTWIPTQSLVLTFKDPYRKTLLSIVTLLLIFAALLLIVI